MNKFAKKKYKTKITNNLDIIKIHLRLKYESRSLSLISYPRILEHFYVNMFQIIQTSHLSKLICT